MNRRRAISLDLVAAKDISYLQDSNEYNVTGFDPFFIANMNQKIFRAGWYLLTVDIEVTKGLLINPRLYFNCGRGENEGDSLVLPNPVNNKIVTLVKFPFDVLGLRFDPCINLCSFKLSKFSLKKISKFSAFRKALRTYKKRSAPQSTYFSLVNNLSKSFIKAGVLDLKAKMKSVTTVEHASIITPYLDWCLKYDTITHSEIELLKTKSTALKKKTLISIVMPVYNPPIGFLRSAIDSVLSQAYPYWELCIADDCSTNPEVKEILQHYQKKDHRIKVVFRNQNGHISECSNSALALVKGEFMGLLDNDDTLPPHALYMVAEAVAKNPTAALFYSDEDKIDENGIRYDPYFKTDWSPDLFLSQNMINHFGVYKTSIIKKIGGFRKGFEGSQDYDLALRFISEISASQVIHIPHVLYHWRAIKGSTALEIGGKNYAYDAGLKSIDEYLKANKKDAIVEKNINHSYRVKWNFSDKFKASIVIPTKDKVEVLSLCVNSILTKTSYKNYEIIIVDNNSVEASTHNYFKRITSEHKNIKVLKYQKPFNFSAITNYGVKHAEGEVLVLLNNDTEVINNDWLDELMGQALRKEIGAVGTKLFYQTGQIQHAGVILSQGHPGIHIYCTRERNNPGYFNKLNLVQNYSAVTAACLAVRKDLYHEVNGLDEENLCVAYNDVDFCLKLKKKGYYNLWTPFSMLYHYESLSRGSDLDEKNIDRFKREHSFMLAKWKEEINNDPFFNRNLLPDTTGNEMKFAFPPKLYEWKKQVH